MKKRIRVLVPLLAIALLFHSFALTAFAEDVTAVTASQETTIELQEGQYTPGVVIFKQRNTAQLFSIEEEAAFPLALSNITYLRSDKATSNARTRSLSETITYRAEVDCDVQTAISVLLEMDSIVDAEPEYIYELDDYQAPNTTTDPRIADQWYLDQSISRAWEAIDQQTAQLPGQDTIVAIIDTGIDTDHPDLVDNLYINEAEANGEDGVDDDGNGIVDDIHGCNMANVNAISNDVEDTVGHGTSIAGVIAMTAYNGVGGVGIAHGTKILPINVYDDGITSTSAAKAVAYAISKGATVINLSFGFERASFLLEDAMKEASQQAVLVAAAGNSGLASSSTNIFPACSDYAIGVMAHNQDGSLCSFSNYAVGNNSYDIVAPGNALFTTMMDGGYGYKSGTSLSTPAVVGAVALLQGYHRDASPDTIIQMLLQTTQTVTHEVDGQLISYPKLDVADSLQLEPATPVDPTPDPPVLSLQSNRNRIELTWTAVEQADGYEIYRASSASSKPTLMAVQTTCTYQDDTFAGQSFFYQVRAFHTDPDKTVYYSDFSETVSGAVPAVASKLTAKATGYNSTLLRWNTTPNASGYRIYRATSANGSYTRIKTITDPNTLSYTDTSLTTNTTYYYKMRAYCLDVSGDTYYGAYSSPVSAKPILSTPTVKATRASYRSIKVSWNKISGASGYVVYRATSSSGSYTKVKTITSGATLSYTNTSLTTGKTYYYKVRAYRTINGSNQYSAYSTHQSAKPTLATPTVSLSSTSKKKVTVKWGKVSDASGYVVYAATKSGGTYQAVKTVTSGATTSFSHTGRTSGKTYYYKVRAYRTINGKRVYSSYSSVKSIKCK